MSGLRIEVVHALPEHAFRVPLVLAEGATVAEALAAADLARTMPGVVPDPARVAIHGRLASPEERLHDGDRVEILRPLAMDPRQARRLRAGRTGGD